MKNFSLVFLGLMVMSCAHQVETPKVVQFPYAKELLTEVQKGVARTPASIEVSDVEEMSPRRVYFSALYHQYLTLGKHLGKREQINFCPQFHHDKIQTDSSMIPQVSMYQASNVDMAGKNYFPELAFNKKFSLYDYHGMIREELEVLCEEGVSDNYFKFDNLVTHYAHKKSFHRKPEAMASVLKIPVFANFYLVKMLETPGFNLVSPEEKRFIRLTQTEWFENYVVLARDMRNNFIKNKMVRR